MSGKDNTAYEKDLDDDESKGVKKKKKKPRLDEVIDTRYLQLLHKL